MPGRVSDVPGLTSSSAIANDSGLSVSASPSMCMCSDASSTRAIGRPRSNVTGSSPRLTASRRRPRCSTIVRASSSTSTSTSSSHGSDSSGRALRSAISSRWVASTVACGSSVGSVQSSLESRKVWTSVGSGTSSAASQPCDANSDRRPLRTASLSRSSGKWEKNCQGVRAPHSSPMNSMGVNGEQSSSAAPHATSPGVSDVAGRSPAARFPTWSWSCT